MEKKIQEYLRDRGLPTTGNKKNWLRWHSVPRTVLIELNLFNINI